MRTSRTLGLWMTGLGLGLCATLLSGCTTPVLKMGTLTTEWGQSGTAEGGHAIVRNGETVESWTELVVLKVIYRPFFLVIFGASTPDKWMDGYQKHLREKHAENAVSMIRKAPDGILFEGVDKGKDGKPDKRFVGRLLDRRASRFIVRYFVKGPKQMTPSVRDKWIDWLLEARIE